MRASMNMNLSHFDNENPEIRGGTLLTLLLFFIGRLLNLMDIHLTLPLFLHLLFQFCKALSYVGAFLAGYVTFIKWRESNKNNTKKL